MKNIYNNLYANEYKNVLRKFSDALKDYMKKYHYTQDDLCKKMANNGCAISRSIISHWLNQKYMPRIDKVDALCKIFNCERSDFL